MLQATTCHPPDECTICNLYADHFDVTSYLTRLDSTDPYTQGLQHGIRFRTQDIDTQASRFRSQLAASHLKLQNFQSESTARQFQIQRLQTQATRSAMEIELLKRELAIERDRVVALETACDELQVELADERRKTINDQVVLTDVGEDWVWNWDDDWEKYESESSEEQPSSVNNERLRDSQFPLTLPSSSEGDWDWVHGVPLGHGEFYWEDYQESPGPSPVERNWDQPSLDKDVTRIQANDDSNWGGRVLTLSNKRAIPWPDSESNATDGLLPSHTEPSIAEGYEGDVGVLAEPTLEEIIELIGVASSIATKGSTKSSIASTATPETAMNRIRALIQQAERAPKHQRSEAQVWLLTNWKGPSLPRPRPVVQLQAPSHPTLDLPAVPEIFVDASEGGVGVYLPLPPHSSSGYNPWQWLAYRWSEKRHSSMFIGRKGRVVIVWAELIAVEMGLHVLRAFGYGHNNQMAGQRGDDEHSPQVNEHPGQKTPVLIRSDNLGVVQALSWLSSPDPTESSPPITKMWPEIKGLNAIANRILRTSVLYNMDLKIRWVRSKENLADGPSRALWDGTWNPRLGKAGFPDNGKQPINFMEEMVDWDVLHARTAMERVPNHLHDCLKPVGKGL